MEEEHASKGTDDFESLLAQLQLYRQDLQIDPSILSREEFHSTLQRALRNRNHEAILAGLSFTSELLYLVKEQRMHHVLSEAIALVTVNLAHKTVSDRFIPFLRASFERPLAASCQNTARCSRTGTRRCCQSLQTNSRSMITYL